VELFDLALWAAPVALVVALVALVARRWVLPLLAGIVGLPVGGFAGRYAWEWFADRPPWLDFGSEFQGYDWVIGGSSLGALVGALAGLWISARRARTA
jgi:hypothetical protein